jgi:hypothetical protein
MVIYVQQGGNDEEEVQHIQMGRLGRGLGVCLVLAAASAGGGLQMAFSLEAKLFRGWRASVEQRQAGSLRVGCGLLAAGRAWWLLMLAGAGGCGSSSSTRISGLAG